MEEQINLLEHFPDMKPVKSAPVMYTLNGFGFGLYGRRDYDEQTNSYLKTHCLCALFIPILALSAYRVVKSEEGGWYFIGKQSLSGIARMWNLAVISGVLLVAGSFFFANNANSPSTLAKNNLAKANQLVVSGKLAQATTIYLNIYSGQTDQRGAAADKIIALLDGPLQTADPMVSAEVLDQIYRETDTNLFPDLKTRGMALYEKHRDTNAQGALAIFDVVAPLFKDEDYRNAQERELINLWVAQQPSNYHAVSRLTALLEIEGDYEQCQKLLTPFRDQLGDSEGARILGQILANQGEMEQAFELLHPYTEKRLEQMHAAEKKYDNSVQRIWDSEIDRLNEGKGSTRFYKRYEAATSEAEQQRIVEEYISTRMEKNKSLKAQYEDLIEKTSIVPVAIDLGIIRLRRAQMMRDPVQRTTELEAAEKTFLAIKSIAGDDSDYQVFLGQVYYWLGKDEQGKAIFDVFLDNYGRNTENLLWLARTVREIGYDAHARELAEDAYIEAKNDTEQYAAAELRSILRIDVDDRIKWLSKADPDSDSVQADLATAQGHQAYTKGQTREAERNYRKAIRHFQNLPETASQLNNCSLVCFNLYGISGDKKDYDRGLDMMKKSITLLPDNSILLVNAGDAVLNSAVQDILAGKIDLQQLKSTGDLDLLGYLYHDQPGKSHIVKQLIEHPDTITAKSYLNRAMILAPKSGAAYSILLDLLTKTRDLEEIRLLVQQLEKTQIDLTDQLSQRIKSLTEEIDPDDVETVKQSIIRLEETVNQLDDNKQSLTYVVAMTNLIYARQAAFLVGLPVDFDELVQQGEYLYRLSPSNKTKSCLEAAYLFRACSQLMETDKEFARFYEEHHRLIYTYGVICIKLAQSGEQQQKILAHPDIQRIIELTELELKDFPDSISGTEYVLMTAAYPEQQQELKERLINSEFSRLVGEATYHLRVLNGTTALNLYWIYKARGDHDKAQGILEEFDELGWPLPLSAEQSETTVN